MRLKYTFEIMELDDNMVAVPVGDGSAAFQGVIKLNDTAAAIFALLKEETTEEAVVDAMAKEYDIDRETLASDVHNYLTTFREKELLAE